MSKDKKKKPREVTRRQFLAGTGIVVGGAAIGSAALLAACSGDGTTETVTQTQTQTQTQTATQTVTSTVGGSTQTVTTTAPGTTQTVTVQVPVPGEGMEGIVSFNVNGEVVVLQVKPHWDLAFVLREKLGLVGLKVSCDRGTCGTCTVIIDGKAVYACMTLASDADGKNIETIEGLSDGVTLHPVQQAFVDNFALQCGYCIPGQIMAAKALLDKIPNPTHEQVREGMSGRYCSCGNTKRIVEAVEAVGGG
jgi:aerobic-type carbon monoxide dehydrogenase small subunit (CoxS/CutS family)